MVIGRYARRLGMPRPAGMRRRNPPAVAESFVTDHLRVYPAHEWVGPVADFNRHRVEAAVAPYGRIAWDQVYGCGAMGCVFPLLDPAGRPGPWVAKITTDENEGGAVHTILETGFDKVADGICRFGGVWQLPLPPMALASRAYLTTEDASHTGQKDEFPVECAYLIVREAIEPWPRADRRAFMDNLLARHRDEVVWRRGRDGVDEPFPPWFDWLEGYQEDAKAGDWADFNEAIEALSEWDEMRPFADVCTLLWSFGIVLFDQHLGQFGYRTHSWPDGQRPRLVRWADGVQRPPLTTYDVGLSKFPGDDNPCAVVQRRLNPGLATVGRAIPLLP